MTQLIRDAVEWVAASPSGRCVATFDSETKALAYQERTSARRS